MANPHKMEIGKYIHRRVVKSLKHIPLHIKEEFCKDVSKWRACNGDAYTVDRLKSIKQVLLHSYSGYHDTMIIPKFEQQSNLNTTSYIKMRPGGRVMHGYLGQLQYLSLQSDKNFEQALMLINAYTLIVDEDVTQEDVDKLCDIIEPHVEPEHQEFINGFCIDVKALKLIKGVSDYLANSKETSVSYSLVDGKSTRIEQEVVNDMSYLLTKPIGLPRSYATTQPYQLHENNFFFSEVVAFYQSKLCQDISNIYPELLTTLPQCFTEIKGTNEFYPVGQMMLINEGGLKKRWVENTKFVVQHLVDKFAQRLYDIVKYLPWDATYDEQKAYNIIQKALRNGQQVHSVDLSKATDKIPMDYNVAILKKLMKRCKDASKYIDVFYLISRAHVALPTPSEGSKAFTRWGTGQPMGARPSFAMLTLVHGLIVYILNDYKWDESFVIHGDDIVILDDHLKAKYTTFLDKSGIEHSEHKTISGRTFAEMNSKVITKTSVLTPVKWKEINIDNFLDVAQYWGPDLVSLVARNNKVSKEEVLAILALPYPLGAGLNPKGLPLDERLKPFGALLEYYGSQKPEQNYIGSFRDLVLRRYSTYATAKSITTGNREIDNSWFQALLHDLDIADTLDKEVALYAGLSTSIDVALGKWIISNPQLANSTYLKGNCPLIIRKPMASPLRAKSRERKHKHKTRFALAHTFYEPQSDEATSM